MPSESELRDRFREGTLPRGEIDVEAVLRRARARRRPRVLLAGAGGVLAVAAIAVPAALTTSLPGGSVHDASAPYSTGESAADAGIAEGPAGTGLRAPAELLNRCGAPVAGYEPAPSGLVISVAPVEASAAERAIPVTVTITNTGSERITGTTGTRPTVTLARDGITIWHTNGPQDLGARVIDLAPGQSVSYPAEFQPLRCSPPDEEAEAFPPDLPAAGPGVYELSAAIDLTSADGTRSELITGPPVEVVLR